MGKNNEFLSVPNVFLFENNLQLLMNKRDNYVPCAAVLEEGESETAYFTYKLFLLCMKEIKPKQVQWSLRS